MNWLRKRSGGLLGGAPAAATPAATPVAAKPAGLTKTSSGLLGGLKRALGLSPSLTPEFSAALEESLLLADCGLPATTQLLKQLALAKLPSPLTLPALQQVLAELITAQLQPLTPPAQLFGAEKPQVIVLAGVNGAGKTTTLGKLAAQWAGQGQQVLVAAADTFRAAALPQLQVWAQRAGVTLVSGAPGADAASVAYQALHQAQQSGADLLLIDTAGRLPNRADLLAELPKLNRVLQKLAPTAPQHTWLVLDATLGQSNLQQIEQFRAQIPLTGLIVTKLDGSAKAGFLLALAQQPKPLPVIALGVGEALEHLGQFEPATFAHALLGLPGGA